MQIKTEFMLEALKMAKKAKEADEVPVGAVVVNDCSIIAYAHNLVEALQDATAHAEFLAIRRASECIGSWRLSECVLYVTLEPCAMCIGACVNSRIGAVVFGAYDEAYGCCASVATLGDGRLNTKVPIIGGVYQDECSALLKGYFAEKRAAKGTRSKRGE